MISDMICSTMITVYEQRRFKDNLVNEVYYFLSKHHKPHEDLAGNIIWLLHFAKNAILGSPIDAPDAAALMKQNSTAIQLTLEALGYVSMQNIFASTSPLPENFKENLTAFITAFAASTTTPTPLLRKSSRQHGKKKS